MADHNGRVLHVIDHLTTASGVASVVMLCITGISQFTQDVAVYGQCDTKMEEAIIAAGGKVHKLPDITKSFGKPYRKAFSALLKDNLYTIIHGHLLNAAFIYLREAKKQGIPNRIIHAHNAVSAELLYKRIRNNILSLGVPLWANRFIAVSDAAARCAFSKSKKALSKVSIIYNGIDTNRFKYDSLVRDDVRKELGISNDVLCVGHVGRFAEQKNHSFLIDIFYYILKNKHSILLLAGDGSLVDSIKAKVKSLGISESVRFLGARHDADRIYQAFDVFLLPSLFEGFPLVAVEAQCAGLPCVISNNVTQEVKCSEHIKFLPLPPGNAETWANVAIELSNFTRSDGSANVKAAKLDVTDMCGSISKIYESMVDSK